MTNKNQSTVIGIDIGAYTSKLAAVQRGAIDIITNEANFRETPSIVGYGPGERKIGEMGNAKLKSNFKNSVVSPTRYLCLEEDNQEIQNQLQFCPCPTQFEGNQLKFKVEVNGNKEGLTAEQVLASYFTQLSQTIRHSNLDQKMIMVAVPSYYTQAEKKALLASADIAGLKNVKLVSESVATGLDYGGFKKSEMKEGKNVLFVDFGHSKLSASLIKFTENSLQVLHEEHNRWLGCRNIDKKIFEYLTEIFKKKTGLDLNENKKACLKLMETIEKQRKVLSGINQTEISIQCLMEDEDISENFSRQLMISSAKAIFEEVKNLLQSLKDKAEKNEWPIDAVELVGGGSRIPEIITIVNQIYGIKPSRTINSSQTIARGATLAAVQESGLFRFHSYRIVHKNQIPVNISWSNKSDTEMEDEGQSSKVQVETLFDIRDSLPAQKQFKLTANGKVSILLSYDILDEVVEKKILSIEFDLKEEKQITVKFEMEQNGFISVKKVSTAEDNQPINFNANYFRELTEKEIQSYKGKEREMYVRDFQIVTGYEKKNQLEGYLYDQKQYLQNQKEFIKLLGEEQTKQAIAALDGILMEISDESQSLGVKQYPKKKEEAHKIIKSLDEKVKTKKKELALTEGYFKELQKLKQNASESMKYIATNFRNSRAVSNAYEQIKNIYQWAEQVQTMSKTKPICQLPLVPHKNIEAQFHNIKQIMDQLMNLRQRTEHMESPRYRQAEPQGRRRQFTQDPFGMSQSQFFGGFPSSRNFFGNGFF